MELDDTIIAPATIPGTGAICVLRVSGPSALEISSHVLGIDLSQQKGYTMRFARVYRHSDAEPAGRSEESQILRAKATQDDVVASRYCEEGVLRHSDAEPAGPYRHSDDILDVHRHSDAESAGPYRHSDGSGATEESRLLDEVVAAVFRAPHSYTGEDSVEISCHSSTYIVGRMLDLFVAAGARLATPGEFTRRAFVSGKMDLTQAESVADLIASTSASEHSVAMKQLKGGISAELSSLRADLLKVNSLLTLELDFSEEEVEFASREELLALCSRAIEHISSLVDSYSLGNALKEGIPVAIVGATNAGKSSLLNALLGHERAIVSSVEGTTRDTIEELLVIDGIKFRFVDTAGLRDSEDEIERIGISRSHAAISDASIVICVVDGTLGEEEVARQRAHVLDLIDEGESGSETLRHGQKVFFVINKCDLIRHSDAKGEESRATVDSSVLLGNLGAPQNDVCVRHSDAEHKVCSEESLRVSAKTGEGIAQLKQALASYEKDRLSSSESAVLLTNVRHKTALEAVRAALIRVRDGLSQALPTDLLAEDLRDALYHLGTINGEITTHETLINIFSHFCIGK